MTTIENDSAPGGRASDTLATTPRYTQSAAPAPERRGGGRSSIAKVDHIADLTSIFDDDINVAVHREPIAEPLRRDVLRALEVRIPSMKLAVEVLTLDPLDP